MALLEQLRRIYDSLTVLQRILTALAAVTVLGGVLLFSRMQKEQGFKPLFQNLGAEDAAVVLARLKETGTEFRLAENGTTVKVPAEKVDELRIQLAAAGIPKSGRIGFELFDKTSFGQSEFSEQVNYHRAVEGELERSVMAISEVEQARVHITLPKSSIFLENRQPAKASVMVKLRPGAKLSPQNILAIAHLTASAVEGLSPEGVSVLDMRGNLLNRPHREDPNGAEPSDALLEYRQRLEKDLLTKINLTLEPLLGADRFRTALSLDCDMTSGEQSEESFDPTKSVMVTAQRSEDASGAPAVAGVPGTSSNLPRPTGRPASATGGTQSHRTENTTFQTSRLVKRMRIPQGLIRRMSVSVLLDHNVRMVGDGAKVRRVVEAPAPERIKAIHDVIAAVVGLQPDRGDQLIVEALPFETSRLEEAQPEAAPVRPRVKLPSALPDWIRVPLEGHLQWLTEQSYFPIVVILFIGGLATAVWLLLRTAVRKASSLRHGKKGAGAKVENDPALPHASGGGALAGPDGGSAGGAAHGEGKDKPRLPEPQATLTDKLKDRSVDRERMIFEALEELRLPELKTRRLDILSRHVAEECQRDAKGMAQLVRTWLTEQEP